MSDRTLPVAEVKAAFELLNPGCWFIYSDEHHLDIFLNIPFAGVQTLPVDNGQVHEADYLAVLSYATDMLTGLGNAA